jgi:hypothetical protein
MQPWTFGVKFCVIGTSTLLENYFQVYKQAVGSFESKGAFL